jgi:membrane associated rhomboid family serine protease
VAARSPTLTLIGVFALVFLCQLLLGPLGVPMAAFALAAPVAVRPWTLVTSVYAHGSVPHLLANTVALAVVGFFLERQTSNLRFHAFFLGSGVVAGLAEVAFGGTFGRPTMVLGASGGIFALLGYLLAGNRVADTLLDRLPMSPEGQLVAFALVAAAVTLATAGPRVALVAHFTGLLLGLLAGRAHLLRQPEPRKRKRQVA